MTTSNVLPMLKDLDMDFNTWEYSDELYSIILTTDLNQNLYPGVDMLYFDTNIYNEDNEPDNGLLKIKRFTKEYCSNILKCSKGSDGSVYGQLRSNNKYRSIQKGDFCYILDGSDLKRDNSYFLKGKVTSVTFLGDRVQITFEGSFINQLRNVEYIVYSGLDFDNITFGNIITEHYKFFGGESTVVKMIPMSDHPWDICYDFDKISGFGMQTATEVW